MKPRQVPGDAGAGGGGAAAAAAAAAAADDDDDDDSRAWPSHRAHGQLQTCNMLTRLLSALCCMQLQGSFARSKRALEEIYETGTNILSTMSSNKERLKVGPSNHLAGKRPT